MRYSFVVFFLLYSYVELLSQYYYRTPSGAKYHLETCRMVENTSHRLTLQEAREMGLAPCKICKPLSHGGTIRGPKKPSGQSKQRFQCVGTTRRGTRCQHVTRIANSYCFQHKPK